MGGDDSSTSGIGGLVFRGARAYFTGHNARELFRAIDVGALLDGGSIDEAIEREQAGAILGRLLGRALADELADGSRIREFTIKLAGQRVGAHLGQAAVVALVEYSLLETAIDEFRTLTTDDAVLGLLDEIEAAATPDGDVPSDHGPTDFDATDSGPADGVGGSSEFDDRR